MPSGRETAWKQIVVYLQPGVRLKVTENKLLASEGSDVSVLNNGLSQHEVRLRGLASNDDSKDEFNRGRRQQILILDTPDDAESVVNFLASQRHLVESAYIKPAAEDPLSD